MQTTAHWIITLVVIILIIIIGFIIWGKGTSQKGFAEQQGGPDVNVAGTPWNDIKSNANWMMVLGLIIVVGGFIGLINVGLHAYHSGMFEGYGHGGMHRGYGRGRSHRYY